MRTFRSVVALVVSLASSAGAYTGTYTAGTGITGTVHDLGTAHNGMRYAAMPADGLQRVCIYCHAPHNTYIPSATDGEFDYVPLWNHALPLKAASYTMYQGAVGAIGAGGRSSRAVAVGMTPGGVSLLCLGCHDGSVAVNAYGTGAAQAESRSGGGTMIAAAYAVGRDSNLANHHPIGFDYDAVQAANSGIRPADSASMGGAGTVRDHLYGPDATRMECGTCHATHNAGNTGESLLWRSDVRSQLCLTCHDVGMNPGAATP